MELKYNKYFLTFTLLIILSLLLRFLIWNDFAKNPESFIQPDTHSYLESGISLIHNWSFPSFSRTPVYPIFLALQIEIFGNNPAIIAISQNILSVATIAIISLVAYQAFGFSVSILTLLFLGLDFQSIINANFLISETLFTLILYCIIFSILLLISSEAKNAISRIKYTLVIFIGLGFPVLSLCRPIALLLFIPCILWSFFVGKRYGFKMTNKIVLISILTIMTTSLWVLRNYQKTGVPFFSTISSINLYFWRAAWNESFTTNVQFTQVQEKFKHRSAIAKREYGHNEGEHAEWLKKEGLGILFKQPYVTALQGAIGFLEMYFEISELKKLMKYIGPEFNNFYNFTTFVVLWRISHSLFLYLGIVSFIFNLKSIKVYLKTYFNVCILFLILIFYFTIFSIGIEAYARFRVPIVPALAIISSIGWIFSYKKIRNPYFLRISSKISF